MGLLNGWFGLYGGSSNAKYLLRGINMSSNGTRIRGKLRNLNDRFVPPGVVLGCCNRKQSVSDGLPGTTHKQSAKEALRIASNGWSACELTAAFEHGWLPWLIRSGTCATDLCIRQIAWSVPDQQRTPLVCTHKQSVCQKKGAQAAVHCLCSYGHPSRAASYALAPP